MFCCILIPPCLRVLPFTFIFPHHSHPSLRFHVPLLLFSLEIILRHKCEGYLLIYPPCCFRLSEIKNIIRIGAKGRRHVSSKKFVLGNISGANPRPSLLPLQLSNPWHTSAATRLRIPKSTGRFSFTYFVTHLGAVSTKLLQLD